MTSAAARDDAVRVLRDRIRTHAPDRYPVQHATARFHLGVTLLQGEQAAAAAAELVEAATLFGSVGMPTEHAKATMMLGVALRDGGRPDEAERAFNAAADTFSEHGLTSEHAATLHNLGMVARDRGDLTGAIERFTAAGRAFASLGERASRASADRELGTTLLAADQPARAVPPLQRAVDDAGARGDAIAWGTAANALGLAHLALDALGPAEEAFRAVVSAHPRSVRPDGYAMAKGNLALVHERAGDAARSRLAARQSRDTPGAPPVVVDEARGVLARLGDSPGDLLLVLDDEPREGWALVLRDEARRWVDTAERERLRAAAAWIDGVLARRADTSDLLWSFLEAVLELPPAGMETVLAALVTVWAERPGEERDAFRSLTSRVLPRFHLPQWQRLQAAFERLSVAQGEVVAWR